MEIKKFNEFENETLNEGYMGLKNWTDSDNASDFMGRISKDIVSLVKSHFEKHINKKDNHINTDGDEDVAMVAEFLFPILDKCYADLTPLKSTMKKLVTKMDAKLEWHEKQKSKQEEGYDAKHLAAFKRMKAFAEKHSK